MCYQCYIELGQPKIINDRVIEIALAIDKLYEVNCCGGDAHIITDDWNVEDYHVKFCLDASNNSEESISKDLSIKVIKLMEAASIDERVSALALHEGIIKL